MLQIIVVYFFLAWLITESINYHMTKKNQDNSFNFRFQNGNGRQSKRLLANLGRYSSFSLLKKKIDKNTNTGFSSRHLLPLHKFVWTAAIGLEVSGSNNIVSILPFYFSQLIPSHIRLNACSFTDENLSRFFWDNLIINQSCRRINIPVMY
jgi:hypothetical protein